MDGWDGGWMEGMDGWHGWMVGWLAGWFVGWLAGWLAGWLVASLVGWLVGSLLGCVRAARASRKCVCAAHARAPASWGRLARNAGDARAAGDVRNTGASESADDAGNAAGLLHIYRVFSLPPT